jgi:peptidoglycan/LPS O-acetylase OafA/YrhL
MENKKRDTTIDFLRGIAVFAMILIHTSYYFLSNPPSLFFWNYAQFAVQVFVYCSAYLFFRKPFVFTRDAIISYLKKRFVRLFLPYYIFLAVYIVINYLFHHSPVTQKYVVESVFVYGGVEIDWLVLLFVQFTVIMPLLSLLWEKAKTLFWGYAFISLISSLYLYFYTITVNYRYLMWLPWSLLCVFAILVINYGKHRFFYPLFLAGSVMLYVAGYAYKHSLNASPSLFDNKYPPNMYFLMYGIAGIIILTYLNKINYPAIVRNLINFLSTFSYPLYFVHYTLLSIATYFLPIYHFTWYTFFAIVFIPSIILQWLYVTGVKQIGGMKRK